ncbi:hypothetical protein HD806DRAFT_329294 [Xylariaceae sp. AK1471]|nr:hypothetical protein HD806DRAFT_329294 [Xylariaceae sp. AK1471]
MEGYARISQLMGQQDECAIYRRFRKLNAMNLLYLQAELTHLEQQLDTIALRDAANDERRFYSKDWWSLSHNEDEEDIEQWEKVLEIRTKLEQYNDTLFKQATIARLGAPSRYDLNFLRDWLVRPRMGNFPLVGVDRHSYTNRYAKDLVAIKARPLPDFFSRWFNYGLFPKWHQLLGGKLKRPTDAEVGQGVYEYDDKLLATLTRIIVTVVASLLPVGSVIAQYFVQNNILRLSLIGVASAFFALALAVMTNARMVEVFAATSACVRPSSYFSVFFLMLLNTPIKRVMLTDASEL